MGATRRESERTGLDPTELLEGLGRAQSAFSQLATTADRAAYLNQVLPLLANVAATTGARFQDVVDEAGEFQRQLGITAAELPAALAGNVAQGRLGSISARDQARHMGAIGGLAGRFLSSAPGTGMQSLATTGTACSTARGRSRRGGARRSPTRSRA
jgi:hypothetical protein